MQFTKQAEAKGQERKNKTASKIKMDKVLALTISEIAKGWVIGSASGIFVFLLFGTETIKEFTIFLGLTLVISFIVIYKINKKIYQT